MARPLKTSIDYFPLDVDFFDDGKVRKIIRACGPASVSIIIALLCNIYKSNGYYILWDKNMPFVIADTVGVTEGAVVEVVKKALQVGFLDNELFKTEQVLTSKGIQRRYFEACRKRKGYGTVLPFLLIELAGRTVKATPHKAPLNQTVNVTTTAHTLNANCCGPQFNCESKARFFNKDNRAAIEMLMANLNLKPEDYDALVLLADTVINEWNLTGTAHNDYADWARHLISVLRIKINESLKHNGNLSFKQKERADTLAGYKQAFDFFEERQRQEDQQRNGFGEL